MTPQQRQHGESFVHCFFAGHFDSTRGGRQRRCFAGRHAAVALVVVVVIAVVLYLPSPPLLLGCCRWGTTRLVLRAWGVGSGVSKLYLQERAPPRALVQCISTHGKERSRYSNDRSQTNNDDPARRPRRYGLIRASLRGRGRGGRGIFFRMLFDVGGDRGRRRRLHLFAQTN